MKFSRTLGVVSATAVLLSFATPPLGFASPSGDATVVSAGQVAAESCQQARQVVARKFAGPDTSVSVMVEARLCPFDTVQVRANARNERASGKTDWAVALKFGVACHSGVTVDSVHPVVPAGRDQPTRWAFSPSQGYWWAEVATTYSDDRHYTGKTSCWMNPV